VIEQLKYTWSVTGLEGSCKYQIVAISSGCQNLRSPGVNQALKLCRYDKPMMSDGATMPVSFGWLNRDGIRYAFYREFREGAQDGHPGNFSAHILFGSMDELDVGVLLRSFSTGFWWSLKSHDCDTMLLPSLDVNSIPQSTVLSKDDAAAALLLERLFRDEKPLILSVNPSAFVSVLLSIHERLPMLVNGLSVSSYEDPKLQSNFNVVCAHNLQSSLYEEPVISDGTKLVMSMPAIGKAIDGKVHEWDPEHYRVSTLREGLQFMADMMDGETPSIDSMIRHVMLRNPAFFKKKMNIVSLIRQLSGSISKTYQQLSRGRSPGTS
jgi:hypothetical protein